MFGIKKRKQEVDQLKTETRKGFDVVKKDVSSMSEWIKHLNSEKDIQTTQIADLKDSMATIAEELEGLKNVLSVMNELKPKQSFKTTAQVFNKHTAVSPVLTGVQTTVQTPNLDIFSVTERAILWVLLNSDLKLSYDDIAAMLGKDKSTIRGQINRIKAKSDIIEEIIEKNGKKRVFIPEVIREKLLKKSKVRVSKGNKSKKSQKISEY